MRPPRLFTFLAAVIAGIITCPNLGYSTRETNPTFDSPPEDERSYDQEHHCR
jgi:hypothetical protein